MISDVISLIDFLRKHYLEYKVKSALFSVDGIHIEGDETIQVEKVSTLDQRVWFYKVKEVDGYEFVYMPVIPSLYIDYGQLQGQSNPDSKIFRFVGNPMAKFTSGGEPNVVANFIIVGYRPKDLLKSREI
ncbi:MAG: hypothetical protein WC575_04115 [Patescibacteria group bacterium]